MRKYGQYQGEVKLTDLEKKAQKSADNQKHIGGNEWLWKLAWLHGYRAGFKAAFKKRSRP